MRPSDVYKGATRDQALDWCKEYDVHIVGFRATKQGEMFIPTGFQKAACGPLTAGDGWLTGGLRLVVVANDQA